MKTRERSITSGNDRERARSSANAAKRAALSAFAAVTALTALVTACSSGSGNSGSGATTGAGRATFPPGQNERFPITTAELSAILLDNQKYARWTFGLKLKQPLPMQSIRIE